MLRHADIWRAIDRLAADHGLSASGLARQAGLDPTTFNKSKRTAKDGRPRWPTTESLAKILQATGASLGDFVTLVGEENAGAMARHLPVIGYAQAGDAGFFDEAGYPSGSGWDEVVFASIDDPHAYALKISGESMAPVFRNGDVVIVSPAAALRPGDRVVLRSRAGEVMAKELARAGIDRVELRSLNPAFPDRSFAPQEIHWMSRILWVGQ